jgi:squalene cyclase
VVDFGAPMPPLDARFAKVDKDGGIAVPERAMPESAATTAVPEQFDDPEWRSLDFAALQRNLDAQRERKGRIRVPTWEEVAEMLPEEQHPKHPVRIRWSLVCRGYQPELAAGWSACTRAFAEESRQDRVFEESLFWIITRTIHCFY